MSVPAKILELVKRFQDNAGDYRADQYKEAQVRQEFVDPFFACLGWDMDNTQNASEKYKEVIHEAVLKIGGATKAPDYLFRFGGAPTFFLETKKPAVNVSEDPDPAYQLRRYAWSAELPLSILTNFEEFAVYDCRVKPDKNDKAHVARVLYRTYKEYAERWDEIAGIFSKNAVRQGSFDKYADSNKRKRGTTPVDVAFLQEIESWRELLAKNLALRNPDLSQRQLNYAVQATVDRIIFLRMCEDRGIESYGQLMALQNGTAVYGRLKQLFRKADDRYNSGLFYFHKEKDRAEPPDELTPVLTVDDKPLKEIIKGLYYPDSPYVFSVLSAEILGQVYEQFLGKVIRLTTGHQAKVEDKPGVKKAGGVYYTPAYIVDYIVQHTVGKLLGEPGASATGGPQGESATGGPPKITPKQAAKLRILDPACGSGSFLLGAYQYLLDWHRDWYVADGPEKHVKELYQDPGGGWRLTTAEKKKILLNNIYGVDIDPQAVEVTKLSLLLKVLEGESHDTLERQRLLWHQRALPDLAANIKCGNSLIGPVFYNGWQLTMFDDDERYRINVFDWNAAFPHILPSPSEKGQSEGTGGFDAVIGNPPYIRIQNLREWAPEEVEHYKRHYQAASKGNYDIYVVFVERGLQLLNRQGQLGFILPHKFFNAQYGSALRELLSRGKHLSSVVHFGDQQVFLGATTYTCLMFLENAGCDSCWFAKIDDLADWRANGRVRARDIPAKTITGVEWNFAVGDGLRLFAKLQKVPSKLLDVAERMGQGIRTSANEVYVLNVISGSKRVVSAFSKQLDRQIKLERGLLFPFLLGRAIKPYELRASQKMVLIPYRIEEGRTVLLTQEEMQRDYPLTFDYLQENRKVLENREQGRMRGPTWYGFVYPKNLDLMRAPKILVPDIADRASFALDERGAYAFTSGYGITLKSTVTESPKYILGLLNSSLLDFFLKRVSTTMRGGFFRYFTQFIEQLPIRLIDFSDPADQSSHDRLVELVEQMLALHRQLAKARTPHDQNVLQGQIDATDRRIDRLVYELYGLTEEEIKIVEGI